MNDNGEVFENTVVVKDIEKTLHQAFCCYGYRNMTGELRDMGWIINHKKVYRLMKEHKLLDGGKIRPEPFKRILSASGRLELNDRCNTCRWTSSMFTSMDGEEMCCC